MHHECYMLTCRVNGKRYIGITRRGAAFRFNEHRLDAVSGRGKSTIHSAIRKYGIEAFDLRILADGISWRDLCHLERDFILQYHPEYNMTMGGDGTIGIASSIMRTAQLKKRDIHQKNCKSWWANATPEQKNKRLAGIRTVKRQYGPASEQTKAKMSASHVARLTRLADEAIAKARQCQP